MVKDPTSAVFYKGKGHENNVSVLKHDLKSSL